MATTLMKDGVEWGGTREHHWYYFYWWNWLPRRTRYIGLDFMFYDGPHWSFGFWFFNWSWSLPINKYADTGWSFKLPRKWKV